MFCLLSWYLPCFFQGLEVFDQGQAGPRARGPISGVTPFALASGPRQGSDGGLLGVASWHGAGHKVSLPAGVQEPVDDAYVDDDASCRNVRRY